LVCEKFTLARMSIHTQDHNGIANGRLISMWNSHEMPHTPVAQVYCTTVFPRMSKGPHLHKKRSGLFCCIRGDVKIVLKIGNNYEVFYSGDSIGHSLIPVPAGIPSMIISDSFKESFVINMPDRPWTPDDPDEWPVENWMYVG
jgi:dTDP-4-dehydrorhamnose 3,5-epimerase-like enzyme